MDLVIRVRDSSAVSVGESLRWFWAFHGVGSEQGSLGGDWQSLETSRATCLIVLTGRL